MAVQQRNIVDNFRLIGVFSSAANFLAALVNESTAAEGMCYYDTTLNQLRTHDGTSWSAAGQNGISAGSINDAFTTGQKITIAGTTGLEIEATDAALGGNVPMLLLDNNDTGSDIHALEIDVIANNTAAAFQITNATTSTKDINGTGDSWYVLGTGYSVFSGLSLGDNANLYLGGSAGTGDVTISFNDDSVGTSGAGLLIEAVAADEQICIGSSAFSLDIWWTGQTSSGNKILFDVDGGINGLGAMQFDNTDLLLGDDDAVVFGDDSDLIIQSDGTDIQITTSTNDTAINIGNGTKDFDIKWFAGDAAKYITFDQSGADVDIVDTDVSFDDDSILQFGTSDDVTIQYVSGSKFSVLSAAVTDMPFVLGGTGYGFDMTYYFESTGTITTDYDGNELAFDLADIRLGDDDYLLFGDSAVAGGDVDGTIRWDNSNSLLEIVGNATFKDVVIVDGDLTVGGALVTTGSWNPGALGLGDDENLTFGDDDDIVIDFNSSADTLYVVGLSIFSKVIFGASSKPLDVTFTGSAANTWFDASSDGFIIEDGGTLNFGSDSDIIFTTASNKLTITGKAAQDAIYFGGGDTTYLDIIIEHPTTSGANFWWDLSGQEVFVGEDGKGWDMTFYADGGSDYMKWVQNGTSGLGELKFEDSVIHLQDSTNIWFGDDYDWSLDSDGTNLIFQEGSAAGKGVHFGLTGTGCDVNFFGNSYNLTWDQGHDALFFADNAELGIGGSAGTHDLQLHSDGTTAVLTGTVNTHILADAKVITFGGTGSTANGTDVTFYSATKGNTIKFDAAANTLTLSGIAQVFDSGAVAYTFSTSGTNGTYGTSSLHISATDNVNAKIQFGLSGTNSLDIIFQSMGSGQMITYDAGISTALTLSGVALFVGSSTDEEVAYKIFQEDDTLMIGAATDTAVSKIQFGTSYASGNSTDVVFQSMGSGQSVTFNAGASALLTLSGVGLVLAASTDSETAYKIYQVADTLMIGGTTDTTVNKIQFGTSYVSGNSTDIVFQSMGSGQSVTFNAGASAMLTLSGVGLIFSASTAVETTYKIYQVGDTLMIGGTTDTTVNKIQFGLSGTNSTDVVFEAGSSGSNITWDAGTATLTSSSTGASFVGQGTSGIWEHAMIIPSMCQVATTDLANGSGAIVYCHDTSKIMVYTGSSWAGVAVAE